MIYFPLKRGGPDASASGPKSSSTHCWAIKGDRAIHHSHAHACDPLLAVKERSGIRKSRVSLDKIEKLRADELDTALEDEDQMIVPFTRKMVRDLGLEEKSYDAEGGVVRKIFLHDTAFHLSVLGDTKAERTHRIDIEHGQPNHWKYHGLYSHDETPFTIPEALSQTPRSRRARESKNDSVGIIRIFSLCQYNFFIPHSFSLVYAHFFRFFHRENSPKKTFAAKKKIISHIPLIFSPLSLQ